MSALLEVLIILFGPAGFVASAGLLFARRYRHNYFLIGIAALVAVGSSWLTIEEYWSRLVSRSPGPVSTGVSQKSGYRQRELLADFSQDTPESRIEAAYGVPSRSKSVQGTRYDEYKGEDHYFYAVRGNGGIGDGGFIGVALLALNEEAGNNFPIPFMKLLDFDEKKKVPVDRKRLSRLPISYLTNRCAEISVANGPDPRFAFFATSKCYFGNPGSYKDFYFGFDLSSAIGDCPHLDWNEWPEQMRLATVTCVSFQKLRPAFAFVTVSDVKAVKAASMAYSVLSWGFRP